MSSFVRVHRARRAHLLSRLTGARLRLVIALSVLAVALTPAAARAVERCDADDQRTPVLSDDGRILGFESAGYVWVRDLRVGSSEPVSRANGHRGRIANEYSSDPAISQNGRFVAFDSTATNLSRRDGSLVDVFVRDRRHGRTILVSVWSGRERRSFSPSISADGKTIAFLARRELRKDRPGRAQAFVRDLRRGKTTLASRADGRSGAPADADVEEVAVSPDGRRVAFSTRAENLTSDDRSGVTDIYVRDLRSGRTRLVSRGPGRRGVGGNHDSSEPSLSATGRYVAFRSAADNLSTLDRRSVYVPGMPDDYYPTPGYYAGGDIFVRDTRLGTTKLVTLDTGGRGHARHTSLGPDLAPDGRRVAFYSRADDLVARDPRPRRTDAFVHDLTQGVTVALDPGPPPEGVEEYFDVDAVSLSAAGRVVAFGLWWSTGSRETHREHHRLWLGPISGGTAARLDASRC